MCRDETGCEQACFSENDANTSVFLTQVPMISKACNEGLDHLTTTNPMWRVFAQFKYQRPAIASSVLQTSNYTESHFSTWSSYSTKLLSDLNSGFSCFNLETRKIFQRHQILAYNFGVRIPFMFGLPLCGQIEAARRIDKKKSGPQLDIVYINPIQAETIFKKVDSSAVPHASWNIFKNSHTAY